MFKYVLMLSNAKSYRSNYTNKKIRHMILLTMKSTI